MVIRIYRNPVPRVPLPSDWLFHAENFARQYVAQKNDSDEEAKGRIMRWAETWYLCTAAFVYYYGGDMQPLIDRAVKTGWTPSEVLEVGKNKYMTSGSAASDQWNFGFKTSGALSKKMFDRSKATIVVVCVLNIPDVDIVGWAHRDEVLGMRQGVRYIVNEPNLHPMNECPGLKDRDKNHWYI